MFDPIPDPISGKSILPWAVPVTRALNAIGDKVGASARNERDRRAANKPLPYEVRWDSSLNSGEGGYKIYLPTEHLLSYAGEDVATSDISGATVIQANNIDTPWYSLDDIDTSADHVWLVVTVTESNGSVVSVDAEFAAEEGQAATGERVHNVCVAEVSYSEPEEEGLPAIVEINQSLVGAIHLGGSAAGEPVIVSADGPFSPIYDTEGEETDVVTGFQNCYWQNGGVTVLMADQMGLPTGTDGFIALKVGATPSTSGTATLECYSSFATLQAAQREVGYFIVPLYRVEDSKIVLDMRRMPVVFTAEVLP